MIAKIQLKLNNDVLLTVIKMVKHTDDYIVENVTDALLISIKEDLINKLEDKAKTIQKQVSILDHNKKHSLVLKYHEAYSMYKLLEAVHEKELFSDNLHIKKIKRLISELHNKLDIFAKEEDITIIDEDLVEDNPIEVTETKPERILVLEGVEDAHTVDPNQVEIPILFDMTDAFSDHEEIDTPNEEVSHEVVSTMSNTLEELFAPSVEDKVILDNELPLDHNSYLEKEMDVTEETIGSTEESNTTSETFPTQETIYSTEEDLFMTSIPESQPKLDWERITTEDPSPSSEKKNTAEQVTFSDPKYNELFNIAKTGINVDEQDLINHEPIISSQPEQGMNTLLTEEEDIPYSQDVMQIEIFDVEMIEVEPSEQKEKKEKKKEKKIVKAEQDGQISLF
ncbi:hypothetical protein HX045_04660 [Myroides odoratimimus]|uniref:hypothetical protein n=1 Tax=Myroides odoratimimus TaxID=76832 RepID=UPI0010405541|nr:hypothetical protein [Myroides odoratimimus]MCA4792510.1 hypothetical protein [Myroides odoratimimus]MCA4805291.1 hypothetical protein [Myroides odoratimimus]MCA4819772.1 hypothetical protein [Myroides odoratimimus]MDM1058900.1 hypothetical protein [Myroides odoratimimus]MDM1065146.1 hypothetical protein [Myroides odoratimimus]